MLDLTANDAGGMPDPVSPYLPKVPIRFENEEDFRRRPLFSDQVDVKGRQLLGYIGDYDFAKSQWVRCGLTCNKIHGHGFVVLLSGDVETNIGHVCGKSHFGLDWDQMTRKCDEDRTRAAKIELVTTAVAEASKTLTAAQALRLQIFEANKLIKPILDLLESDYPLQRAFAACCKAYGAVFHERYLTERERGADGQSTIRERIGTIDGYASATEHDLDRELRREVIDRLEALTPVYMDKATEKQLTERLRDIRARAEIIQRAELFVADAQRFARRSNWVALETLCNRAKLGVSRRARDRLRDLAGMPQPKY